MRWHLKHALAGMALAGMVGMLGVGAMGWNSVVLVNQQLDEATRVGDAMRSAALADMMHDAVRSDVLQAILSGQTDDPRGLAESKKDLAEHGEALLKHLEATGQSAGVPEVEALIQAALPVARAYVEQGRTIQGLVDKDPTEARSHLPEFQRAFDALEHSLEQPGERLDEHAERVRAAGAGVVGSAIVEVMAVALLGVLVLGVLAWRIVRRVLTSIRSASQLARAVSSGDLTQSIRVEGYPELRVLLHHLNEMNGNLRQVIDDVRVAAEAVATGGEQVAQGNNDLSARTESQASSLEETAAAMHQVSTSVQQNAEQVREASARAAVASQLAEAGGQVVADVVLSMRRIEESSRQIADIIGVIDGIAFQTNILALNAAVEAARAGEAGRGFAVVASEVRSLAGRSAQAAREIKTLITASVQEVSEGTRHAGRAGETMGEVVTAIAQATRTMQGMADALREQ